MNQDHKNQDPVEMLSKAAAPIHDICLKRDFDCFSPAEMIIYPDAPEQEETLALEDCWMH